MGEGEVFIFELVITILVGVIGWDTHDMKKTLARIEELLESRHQT